MAFPNAIRKYGKDVFFHEILEICNTLEAANVAEIKWIEFYDTRNPERGFNLARGGDHKPHPKKNPMDRPEFREKALQTLAKINASLTPAQRSAHAKELWKDSSANKQAWSDPVMRTRSSEVNKEIKARPEVKKQASESSQLLWQSKDTELNMPNGGRILISKLVVRVDLCTVHL